MTASGNPITHTQIVHTYIILSSTLRNSFTHFLPIDSQHQSSLFLPLSLSHIDFGSLFGVLFSSVRSLFVPEWNVLYLLCECYGLTLHEFLSASIEILFFCLLRFFGFFLYAAIEIRWSVGRSVGVN